MFPDRNNTLITPWIRIASRIRDPTGRHAARCKQLGTQVATKEREGRRGRCVLAWPNAGLEADVSCMIHCNCQRPRLSIHPWRGHLSSDLSNSTMHVDAPARHPVWWASLTHAEEKRKKTRQLSIGPSFSLDASANYTTNKQDGQFSGPNELRLSAYILIDGATRLRM